MATNIQINAPLNASVQPGDIIHYIRPNANLGGFTTHIQSENIVTIGKLIAIKYSNEAGVLLRP